MPHESTVKHQMGSGEVGIASSFTRARSHEDTTAMSSPTKRPRQLASPKKQVPHLRADLPQRVTHHHDEGDDSPDDDSSSVETVETVETTEACWGAASQ